MDFVSTLKEHFASNYPKHVELSKSIGCKVKSLDEYIENSLNQAINCGGYALEIYKCIFPSYDSDFERPISALLEIYPFIRLLGNTTLAPDEYIVKYRADPKAGHHFIKFKDGIVTEKDGPNPIQDFADWAPTLKDAPEATFAVKREHEIFSEHYDFAYIDKGKNFDETVSDAYQHQQNVFSYHSQNYSFKKDPKTGAMYICSKYGNRILTIADLLVEDGDCIAVVRDGFDDYVSNTKTNYQIGPSRSKDTVDIDDI